MISGVQPRVVILNRITNLLMVVDPITFLSLKGSNPISSPSVQSRNVEELGIGVPLSEPAGFKSPELTILNKDFT